VHAVPGHRLHAGDARAFPYTLFQEASPLSAVAVAVSSFSVPRALLLGVAALVLARRHRGGAAAACGRPFLRPALRSPRGVVELNSY